jgi:peptidoglycan hydrolase CwlO-like protein
MKRKNILVIIGLVFFLIFSFIFLSSYKDEPVFAQASCPSSMDPDSSECLNYLYLQLEILREQEGTIQKQLEDEEYQQLTLSEKITYINNQITQTEKVIKSLEVEIAANDVEIKLFEEAITELEDNISLLKQEILILEESVTKRVTESYKYSYVGPLELFLDIKNLSNILRKTKYLAMTRSQDKKSLENYGVKIDDIESEERILAEKKADLQIARNSIEEERIELSETRESLSIQKVERERLLAESKAKQAELLVELKRNKEIQSQLDAKIIAYINAHMGEMVEEGYVAKGGKIGYIYPGGNSCSGSSGPHLHFGASTTSSGSFYTNIDLYKGGYLAMGAPSGVPIAPDGWDYKLLLPGKYSVPIAGSGVYITQDYHDPNLNYVQDYGETQFYATDLSKLGGSANATVLAAEAGWVSRGRDYCGQDYVIIKHPNGYRTIYVHLSFSL